MAAPTPEPLTERYRRWAGPGAVERSAPTASHAVAGIAALLAGFAVAALGAKVLEAGQPRGLAALVGAAYGVAGLVALARGRGPQRSAGAVAVMVSVPLTLGYLILGDGDVDRTEPATVVALATVAAAVLHVAGPGRGRPLFLAVALVGAWLTPVVQLGVDALVEPFDTFGYDGGLGPGPDTTALVIVSLLFGIGYLAAGSFLDRAGLRGTATAFIGVGDVALAAAVVVGATGREQWLSATLVVAAGAYVGFVGARLGRRLTTWAGTAAFVIGIVLLFDAAVPDDAEVTAALVALVVSTLVAALTPALADALGEDGLHPAVESAKSAGREPGGAPAEGTTGEPGTGPGAGPGTGPGAGPGTGPGAEPGGRAP